MRKLIIHVFGCFWRERLPSSVCSLKEILAPDWTQLTPRPPNITETLHTNFSWLNLALQHLYEIWDLVYHLLGPRYRGQCFFNQYICMIRWPQLLPYLIHRTNSADFKVPFSRKKSFRRQAGYSCLNQGVWNAGSTEPTWHQLLYFSNGRGKANCSSTAEESTCLPCSRTWNWARSWETWDLKKITQSEELSILTGFHWERLLQHCLRLDNIRLHEIRSALSHFLPNFY